MICETKAEGNRSINVKHPEGEHFKLGAQDWRVKGAVDTLGDAHVQIEKQVCSGRAPRSSPITCFTSGAIPRSPGPPPPRPSGQLPPRGNRRRRLGGHDARS